MVRVEASEGHGVDHGRVRVGVGHGRVRRRGSKYGYGVARSLHLVRWWWWWRSSPFRLILHTRGLRLVRVAGIRPIVISRDRQHLNGERDHPTTTLLPSVVYHSDVVRIRVRVRARVRVQVRVRVRVEVRFRVTV